MSTSPDQPFLDALGHAMNVLHDLYGAAAVYAIGEDAPELTDELVEKLWALFGTTVGLLAYVHDNTPRGIVQLSFKRLPDDETFRGERERLLEHLRRQTEGEEA